MKKTLLILLVSILVLACRESKKNIDNIEMAERYINALNASDFNAVTALFADSIRLKEIDYVSAFSKEDYYSMFQWDSTFAPKYQILEIREVPDGVSMQVLKACKRILFLNEEPIITDELVRFGQNKITRVEILDYIVFNDDKWSDNRAGLVHWIATNHPELDGFLYDQTKQGALEYLKAIAYYREREKQ